MNIQKEASGSLKVELSVSELHHFHLTYEQLDYQDKKTKAMLKAILESAGRMTGFDSCQGKMLVEVFPAPGKGCIIYFTKQEQKGKRYRRKLPAVYSFDTAEAMLCGMECLAETPDIQSELYRLNNRYLLILHEKSTSLVEYGNLQPAGRLQLAYIREHGQLLAAPRAVATVLHAAGNEPQ